VETWLDDSIPNSLLTKDYNIFRQDRKSSPYGGVLILIPKSLSARCIPDLTYCLSTGFECLSVLVNDGINDSTVLSVLYRSPSCDITVVENFLTVVSNYPLSSNRKVICGDCNVPGINWSQLTGSNSLAQRFVDKCSSLGLFQKVSFPTRNAQSLDLIFTSHPNLLSSVTSDLPFGFPLQPSDHVSISCTLNSLHNQPLEPHQFFDFRNANWSEIALIMYEIDWDDMLSSCTTVDDLWSVFKRVCQETIETFIPKRLATSRPSMSADFCKLRRLNFIYSRLRLRYKQTNDTHTLLKLRTISAKINSLRRRIAHASEEVIANSTCSRNFWSFVNGRMSVNNSFPIITDTSGRDITTEAEQASSLNEYFNTVYNHENPLPSPPAFEASSSDLDYQHLFSPMAVFRKLCKQKSKTSVSHDGIPSLFLKMLAPALSDPLSRIFSTSFASGLVPKDWKHSIIAPAQKTSNNSSVSNFRPISLTPTCSKVMESIIREFLSKEYVLNNNNIFDHAQYGFIERRSTELQLLSSLNDWTIAADSRKEVHVLYLDIRKAFDSVPHSKLLEKLRHFNLPNQLIHWLHSFLSNRTHSVKIGNQISSPLPAPSGVPQGAVLSPFLFISYINSVPKCVTHSTCKLYADDFKLYKTISTSFDCDYLQRDLDNILRELNNLDLQLSLPKCKVLTIKPPRSRTSIMHSPYSISNCPLTYVELIKDLGVLIDNKLNFSPHINKIVQASAAKSACISNCFLNRSPFFRKRLLQAHVRPHLEYASTVWNIGRAGHINSLERPQRRLTKNILGFEVDPYPSRLTRLGIENLFIRRLINDLATAFKIFKNYYLDIDYTAFFTLAVPHRYDTRLIRHRFYLEKPMTNTTIRDQFWSVRIIDVWNKLPDVVFNTDSVSTFKRFLQHHFRSELASVCKHTSIDFLFP
jgi:hypothetical protein